MHFTTDFHCNRSLSPRVRDPARAFQPRAGFQARKAITVVPLKESRGQRARDSKAEVTRHPEDGRARGAGQRALGDASGRPARATPHRAACRPLPRRAETTRCSPPRARSRPACTRVGPAPAPSPRGATGTAPGRRPASRRPAPPRPSPAGSRPAPAAELGRRGWRQRGRGRGWRGGAAARPPAQSHGSAGGRRLVLGDLLLAA